MGFLVRKAFLAEEETGQWPTGGSMPGWSKKNKETSMAVAGGRVKKEGRS